MIEPQNEPGDPVGRAIYGGMCDDIRFLLENKRQLPAVLLIFAALDAMAHLGRPANKAEADSSDFKDWAARYFRVDGTTTVTPQEWWAARCAIVHTYGAYSRTHKQPGVRVMVWIVGTTPGAAEKVVDGKPMLFVNVAAMHAALVKGIEQFLIDICKDPARKAMVEPRLKELLQPVHLAGSIKQFIDAPADRFLFS
jgi:hypothetical protein